MEYIFEDYTKTKKVYHIVSLNDLDRVIKNGICYDDKITYNTKYKGFHDYIDKFKGKNIPSWVMRSKCIFASLNYKKDHNFHSHSAILSVNIDEERCWIANENLANVIYEPFALRNTVTFENCKSFLDKNGERILKKYWDTSISFKENLKVRKDLKKGYDAEVLICHPISKEDIQILYICSDHKIMSLEQFNMYFS
ncbi:hypothetical protein SAMN05661008_00077 [Alkalithermobacter thermoalcaliphilus JW-YL-7 = DSM 7308]|uniref:DarT domain-containing protein n=1 Tax=Alkalithermobacter thermoalcaliphilus JW-YL-7 = DSM 7308 TaxID=1121328 RepID=A0A150FRZ7_CLOPD|nr:hypothetical protein JWYL7_1444 [[Clostridium] paradoxum JW-YL-7 = DSM 7308]SHK35881.1 hypothetical protein SAMN05661008_00077 [[Clostridium] paradoxum JW-YL-7 = DSM 7308]